MDLFPTSSFADKHKWQTHSCHICPCTMENVGQGRSLLFLAEWKEIPLSPVHFQACAENSRKRYLEESLKHDRGAELIFQLMQCYGGIQQGRSLQLPNIPPHSAKWGAYLPSPMVENQLHKSKSQRNMGGGGGTALLAGWWLAASSLPSSMAGEASGIFWSEAVPMHHSHATFVIPCCITGWDDDLPDAMHYRMESLGK